MPDAAWLMLAGLVCFLGGYLAPAISDRIRYGKQDR